ncbi:MAG: cation transporter [Candidatus Pacebacteria bacterium]|nr:cation transporter [Candidatus Paceibacterota bacterium]
MKQTFSISGMHCGACVKKVETAVGALSGIRSVLVDLPGQTMSIESDPPMDFAILAQAVAAAGPYTLKNTPVEKKVSSAMGAMIRRVMPLFLMLVLVTLFALVKQVFFASPASFHGLMQDWMAGFFLLFGGLKIINLRNFAVMYRGYDVLATRFAWWGYVYPFLEVTLGLLFLFGFALVFANVATIALMGLGMIGIYKKIHSEGEVQCACLGGFFNVPVTWLTFAENGLMVVMAVWMLFA